MNNQFRSHLATARGLGSGSNGTWHWIEQRITAVILVVFVLWLLYFCAAIFGGNPSVPNSIAIIQKPYNAIMLMIFTIATYYHAYLGIQVVIEDYVSCRMKASFLMIFCKLFSFATVIAVIVAILHIMNI